MAFVSHLLLLLLVGVYLCHSVMYQASLGPRSAAPLATVTSGLIGCGIRCLMNTDCTHWTFDPPGRRCVLYPTLRSDASHSTINASIYFSREVPDKYKTVANANKAFRVHFSDISGNQIVEQCASHGSRHLPAAPENDGEFLMLKGMTVITPNNMFWIGVHQLSNAGVYGDFFGRVLPTKNSWLTGRNQYSTNLPCCRMFNGGIDLNACYPKHPYACQFEMY